jgi:hypothetical protein
MAISQYSLLVSMKPACILTAFSARRLVLNNQMDTSLLYMDHQCIIVTHPSPHFIFQYLSFELFPSYNKEIAWRSDHPIWLLAFGVMGVIGSVIASSTLTDCCVAGDEGE